MTLSLTDSDTIARYLADAARFYAQHAQAPKHKDRARLLGKMAAKVRRKVEDQRIKPDKI